MKVALAIGGALAAAAAVTAWLLLGRDGAGMGAAVQHRERALGVDPRLQGLLDDWQAHGSHDVLVAPDGGVRSRATQRLKFEAGRARDAAGVWRVVMPSNVISNADEFHAPHVRGGALDVHPVGFNSSVPWPQQPESIKAKFKAFGEFAEARGFVWLGRATKALPPYGDQPHVEVPDWMQRPMPPSENYA